MIGRPRERRTEPRGPTESRDLKGNCDSREQLGGVLVDLVELPADVVAEVDERLVDVPLARESGGLVLLLPRLDVDDGEAGVERVPEVLQERERTGKVYDSSDPGEISLHFAKKSGQERETRETEREAKPSGNGVGERTKRIFGRAKAGGEPRPLFADSPRAGKQLR